MLQHFFEWVVRAGITEDMLYLGDYLFVNNTLMSLSDYVTNSASSLTGIFSFGGTTLLIVVGVANELYRELEAQLTMRNYKGFLN